MKVCRDCYVEQPLSEFYKHGKMQDGHLNKCKSCVKKRVTKRRNDNINEMQEYERKRSMLPHRVQSRKESAKKYAQTEAGKEAKRKAMKLYFERYPLKRAAHIIVGNALRDGRLTKQFECSVCNSNKKIEAHHNDYTKPFDVRWLCEKCHKNWHKTNMPIYS